MVRLCEMKIKGESRTIGLSLYPMKYWETTVAPVSLPDVGVWETSRPCFISEGSEEMIDPNVLEGYALVDLTDPGNRPAGAVCVDLVTYPEWSRYTKPKGHCACLPDT